MSLYIINGNTIISDMFNKEDSLKIRKFTDENLALRSVLYHTNGQFTFSTFKGASPPFIGYKDSSTSHGLNYYLYSIPTSQLKKIYTLNTKIAKSYPYFHVISLNDALIIPQFRGVFVNDTLLLIGGSMHRGLEKYIFYINPEKDKIIRQIQVPSAEAGPEFVAYSKSNGLVAFNVQGYGYDNFRFKTCLLDIKTGKVKVIKDGQWIFPRSWLDDSLLLIQDDGDIFYNVEIANKDYFCDFYTYNINTGKIKKIIDDVEAWIAYKVKGKMYYINQCYKRDTTIVTIKDENNNKIKEASIPLFMNYEVYIPYPEDTISAP